MDDDCEDLTTPDDDEKVCADDGPKIAFVAGPFVCVLLVVTLILNILALRL